MERWLKEELENKARMEQFDMERKAFHSVKSRSDFALPNPDEIRSLCIDCYDGMFDSEVNDQIVKYVNLEAIDFCMDYQRDVRPEVVNTWLSMLPKVKKLSFRACSENTITWSALAAIDLSRIESLTVSMKDDSQPIPLKAPILEEFIIYGRDYKELSQNERSCIARIKYDFSGMPSLRKLQLKHCGFWDYSELACLTRLVSLVISDLNLMDLSWMSENYSLLTLNISACIEDLCGIEKQPCLENLYLGSNKISDVSTLRMLKKLKSLDLRCNNISDVSPLEALEFLEYLNLEGNPFVSEENLRKKRIRTLLINSQDKILETIDRIINDFSRDVHRSIKNEDTYDLSQLREWQLNARLKNRQKPYEERFMEKIQYEFEQEFKRVTPLDLWQNNHSVELTVYLREEYIRRASSKYPFLKVTPEMQIVLQREISHTLTEVPKLPGIVFFANDDFVRIYVKVKGGSGQIKQRYDNNYDIHPWMKKFQKIEYVIKNNWEIFFPNKKMTDFDFEIVYAPLYGKEVDEKISCAVLFAMWSAVHQIIIPRKTAVLLKCSSSGRLEKEEARPVQVNVAIQQGIEQIISWMPKKKKAKHATKGVSLFNTFDEFVEYLYRQEIDYYKYKELDSFRIKLVDIIRQYIPEIEDQRQIQSVLRDCFPDRKKDVNLLILLLKLNILEKIKDQSIIDRVFVSRFVSLLENEYGIGAENAQYAVHTWCLCYGKYTLDKICNL